MAFVRLLLQLVDGDIVCFQKSLSVETSRLIQCPDVPTFLEYQHNLQVLSKGHWVTSFHIFLQRATFASCSFICFKWSNSLLFIRFADLFDVKEGLIFFFVSGSVGLKEFHHSPFWHGVIFQLLMKFCELRTSRTRNFRFFIPSLHSLCYRTNFMNNCYFQMIHWQSGQGESYDCVALSLILADYNTILRHLIILHLGEKTLFPCVS